MKKRIGIFITILMMSVLCVTVFAQSVVKMDGGSINVKSWIKNNFSKGKVPPFSFEYGGDSSKNFITKWTYAARQTDSDDPNVVRYVYTYKDPKSLLVVECDVKGYLDSEAVEWVLRFRNEGSENSKPISKVDVSDIVFNHKAGDTNVYYAKGTNDAKDDFAPLFKSVSVGENL
jgi:alpha-galactosidase